MTQAAPDLVWQKIMSVELEWCGLESKFSLYKTCVLFSKLPIIPLREVPHPEDTRKITLEAEAEGEFTGQ